MKPALMLLFAVFAFLGSAGAEPLVPVTREPLSPVTREPIAQISYPLSGIELAEGIAQITGTAISPLLGVSSVGAWRYYRTPSEEREQLPWFCHPIAWGIGFALLGLCFLKDVAGTAAPTLLKKPFDFAELFEDKLSALIAGSAFIPFIAAEMARHSQLSSPETSAALLPEMHLAAMPFLAGASATAITALVTAIAVVAFFLVWLSCHAINVLIALSPFTLVDTALKLLKAGLLSLVTATAFVNPWLGVAICFGIVLIAGLVAPWAFRLTLFGSVFSTDLFRFRLFGRTSRSDLAGPRVFVARRFNSIPARTMGRLVREEEERLVFRYRPWLVLPARDAELPAGSFALSKGLLCPVLLHGQEADARTRTILLLLPRYCSQETAIAEHLRIADVRDGAVVRGFKAIGNWMADAVGVGGRKQARLPA